MAISGFPDIPPKEQGLFYGWKSSVEKTFQCFGFSPMEELMVESIKVLTAKGNDHEIYTLGRLHGGESKDLALRFDLTIPLARYIRDYKGLIQFPYARYCIGPVFRGERAQEGRYRQFTQCDIDIVGQETLSPLQDAYGLFTAYSALESLNLQSVLGPVHCRINHKIVLDFWLYISGLSEEKAPQALRLMDKRGKAPWEDLRRDIIDLGISSEALEVLDLWSQETLPWKEALTTLEDLGKKFLKNFPKNTDTENTHHSMSFKTSGAPELSLESFLSTLGDFAQILMFIEKLGSCSLVFDPLLARGLTYYSGLMAEFFLPDYPHYGSIGAGGRYDNLVSSLEEGHKKNKNIYPGVGFSIGLTRLFFLYTKERDKKDLQSETKNPRAQVLLALESQENLDFFTSIFSLYKKHNISTFFSLENKSLSHHLRYASREDIPWVVFLDQKNHENTQEPLVQLRFLPTGEQHGFLSEDTLNVVKKGHF